MAYGNAAPKEWHSCPKCHEPLHESEHCHKCGLKPIKLEDKQSHDE